MSKPKKTTKSNLHTFELRQREGATGPMAAGNAELLMDGVKMKGVRNVSIAVSATGLGVLSLEVYGHFNAIGTFEPIITEK
jgi:hypothetical protein